MTISVTDNIFREEYLQKLAEDNASKYQSADPFPHISFDNFISPEILEDVLKEFPTPEKQGSREYKDETSTGKLASLEYNKIPSYIRYVLDQFNTAPFLQFLETLTGIKGLIPDPYFGGGGIHQTKSGGWLSMHVDFNRNNELKVYRRINVILYLNKDWEEKYGGSLELWDKEMKECKDKILPIFNRVAIFNTSDISYHGHPDPLTCPEDMTRKSLAWYYYTVDKGEMTSEETKGTRFKQRPGKDSSFAKLEMKEKVKDIIRNITPPILIKLAKKVLYR